MVTEDSAPEQPYGSRRERRANSEADDPIVWPAALRTTTQPTPSVEPAHHGARVRVSASPNLVPPKRRRRWVRALVGWLVALGIVVGLGAVAYQFLQGPINAAIEKLQPAPDYAGNGIGTVDVTIESGHTGTDIGNTLVKAGVVKSLRAFLAAVNEASPTPQFYPGVYRMAEQMSAKSALARLADPEAKLVNAFVIPEGTKLVTALKIIAEGTKVPLDQLTAASNEPPSGYGLPAEAKSLEGFLFPATYSIDPGTSAHDILKQLVDRQFKALDDAGVPVEQRWRTIVLAALVQREAGLAADYPKVARVFLNRLDPKLWDSGLLQSDATVSYGVGSEGRVETTPAERADAANVYNTYVHPGLPPGPISNPGDVAIRAALHPADGPWLYFVTVNLDSGETIFSTTLQEHEAAVTKWQAWMRDHPEYE